MSEQELKQDTVVLECKVQTIYYENAAGKIEKYHHVSNERINMTESEQILIDVGINVNIILRVLTERIGVELTRQELQERLVNSERFYQRNN